MHASGAGFSHGLLLLLLPVIGRRGSVLEGAAVGLLAGGGVLVLAALTPMPGRYVIQQAPRPAPAGEQCHRSGQGLVTSAAFRRILR